MTITKLDAAEREIVAAIQLLFDGGDPIPVYALAAAAREITTTLCEKRGVHSMVDAIQDGSSAHDAEANPSRGVEACRLLQARRPRPGWRPRQLRSGRSRRRAVGGVLRLRLSVRRQAGRGGRVRALVLRHARHAWPPLGHR